MKNLLLVAILGSSSFLFAQLVCVGTTEQCKKAHRELCASEPAPANLELSEDKFVTGTVLDVSGATFNDVDATGVNLIDVGVELRAPNTSVVLQSTAARNGTFDFGKVKAGSYRMVVVKRSPRGPERLKLWDQAKSLACKGSTTKCEITVVLTIHGTDNPIDFCPPK